MSIILLPSFLFLNRAQAIDLGGIPEKIEVTLGDKAIALNPTENSQWSGEGVTVSVKTKEQNAYELLLTAPGIPVKNIRLHWNTKFDAKMRFLGDAWERSYGDLQWKNYNEITRVDSIPWYFIVSDGRSADGYGVMTGPAALCSWQINDQGVDLLADVRSGSSGVQLGNRTLSVCTMVTRKSTAGESIFAATRAFCRRMNPHSRIVAQPVYGFNDWYCAYGHNTARNFLADAAYIASLSPTAENKPYMVIDDGWQANRQGGSAHDNPWKNTNVKFGSSMPAVAQAIKAMNARPGLWYRPLEAWPDCPQSWLLKGKNNVLDPSNPEVLHVITENIRRFHSWGYEMVKHDFSTKDITGEWGNNIQKGLDTVTFADNSKTTAEIISFFYQTLRDAAGDGVLLDGCNTLSHLSAGIFDLTRIGDDTSGNEWARTRTMGINCLAFRGVQNGIFYLTDADCAGLAKVNAIPWRKNMQWLQLLAHSGTPLFVSWPKELVGTEQEATLREALSAAAQPQPLGEPIDWMDTMTPSHWKLNDSETVFAW